ncbi:hypothetical protein K4K61_007341 [Colletotrichum sp. SAR11_59]|nr:hypothetical protein K4K61_007341 [Colletotrichum sp. SAR11_59]
MNDLSELDDAKGEFSSAGYPFEPGKPVYLGEDGDPDRHEISLKYAFYILVDEADHGKDSFFEQYALVNPLRKYRNDVDFRQRLRRGLVELFSAVRDMAREQCESEGLRITSIGLSVPSQWTIEFEDVYRDIIAEVFDELTRPEEQICFHTETEALAHFLLRNHIKQLLGVHTFRELKRNSSAHKPLLFLDFGGHNMNGCMFNAVCAGEETASFYSMSDPFGKTIASHGTNGTTKVAQ